MINAGEILRSRYRIDSFLGRGGMADVYLALDTRRQVQVAIKVLREDLAEDPEFIQRFRREADALARLDHPYIVRFYSFERQGTTAFIVMDYIGGTTLRGRIAEVDGPLPFGETTQILRQMGAALQYAHSEGYIHRDIKPGNILIREDGTALLADFGIARAAEISTMTLGPLGAPAYMSPEQIKGGALSPRSDIYSLGIVLYQMVTGRRPFRGENESDTGTMSKMRAIQQEQLHQSPPDPASLRHDLPTAASGVILKALAKSPDERWSDVMTMVGAWEDALGLEHRSAVSAKTANNSVPAQYEQVVTSERNEPARHSYRPPVPPEKPPAFTEHIRRWPWLAFGIVIGFVIILLLILQTILPKAEQAVATQPQVTTATAIIATPADPEQIAFAILTATAEAESQINDKVRMTTEALQHTATSEAGKMVSARETATRVWELTATTDASHFKEEYQAQQTATAMVDESKRARVATATRSTQLTATAQAKKKSQPKPVATPKPKPKPSGARCFEGRERHWEGTGAGAGVVAGVVYDRNKRPFNGAQVQLSIVASNWDTLVPIAPDGIYTFCCLSFGYNRHITKVVGNNIRTLDSPEFSFLDFDKNKVLIDFWEVDCN